MKNKFIFFFLIVVWIAGLSAGCGTVNTATPAIEDHSAIQYAIHNGYVTAFVTLPEPTKEEHIQYPVIFHVTLQKNLYSGNRLTIPAGTVLQAPGSASPLVIGQHNCFVIVSELNREVQQTCAAYSLDYSLTQAKKMPAGTQYIIDTDLAAPLLLALFTINNSLQEPYSDYVTQVALWRLNTGAEIDEIKIGSGWNISDDNAEKAADLAANAEDQIETEKVSKASPILIIVGSVLGVSVLLAGVITLVELSKKQKKKRAETVAASNGLSNVNWNTARQIGQTPPPTPEGKPLPPAVPAARKDLLNGISGPLAGKKIVLRAPLVITRGKVEWLLFPDESLSSPEILFDLVEMPFRYKVLCVSGKKFIEVTPGVEVTLSNGMTVSPLAGKIMVTRGSRAGRSYGEHLELAVISREQFETIVTGDADARISDMHVLIHPKNGDWWIKDLNSSNGTRVNGNMIESESIIKPGDKIIIGQSEFIYEISN